MMRRVLLVLMGIVPASPVLADDLPGASFVWVRGAGAEACASTASLQVEVAERLGRDPFQPPITQHIEGIVRRSEGTFVATLYNRDPEGALVGEREFRSEAEDCDGLAAAVVLAVALAIDPEAALTADQPVDRTAEANEPGIEARVERESEPEGIDVPAPPSNLTS
ncbi:MAG: hypothetical protein AAGF12_43935, partial [Myxococcota bacterium]